MTSRNLKSWSRVGVRVVPGPEEEVFCFSSKVCTDEDARPQGLWSDDKYGRVKLGVSTIG